MLGYIILKHYIPIVLCILSCAAVIPTIYVTLRNGLCRPLSVFLTTLAIVDLLTCFLLMFLSLDHFILPKIKSDRALVTYSLIEGISGEGIDVLLMISNWLTVIVGVERYIAVGYPLNVRRISRRVRKHLVIAVFVVAVILQIPSIIRYFPQLSGLWHSLSTFNVWFTKVTLLLILPCGILLFVNIRLIQAVRSSFMLKRHTLYGCQSDTQQQCTCKATSEGSPRHPFAISIRRTRRTISGEKKLTLNLICLIIVFFVCQVPFILLTVVHKLLSTSTIPQSHEEPALETLDYDFINMTLTEEMGLTEPTDFSMMEKIDAMAYVRAFAVIFLMLKGDLYFLFYCWLCDKFSRALHSVVKVNCCGK